MPYVNCWTCRQVCSLQLGEKKAGHYSRGPFSKSAVTASGTLPIKLDASFDWSCFYGYSRPWFPSLKSFPLEYSRQKKAQLKEENFPIKHYLKIWLLFPVDELNSWIENVGSVKWP